ncbi:Alstrom syndrome protein 1 isoform X8 [Marmota marmota marmota]|uniref:Alstrom syndrome protein 1 isoform X8 n=1 Tax=Marmota marmota marmota TaxID=9994 RepID=UPI002093B487|nr:Alstrom syndrome protein 1 isoform X8 [Marmota marmota marmota]
MDSSQSLDISQTRINIGAEGSEVIEFPSLEEGILTQSEEHVKERNRNLLCSPLLVIQDNFASPDLPLLTCLTQDQELGSDSLFHQSQLDFAPLRGIPDKTEDIEWFSRPSEVSEALYQATSEVSSDLVNSCFSVSQHVLTGSTAIGSQRSFLSPEQENNKENTSSNTVDELKIPKDSDNYDALCSYMSWKTQKDIQQPGNNFADKDQVSVSTLSDISDENIAPKRSDSFNASGLHVHWEQEPLQQTEPSLTNMDHVSFPHEVAYDNKMSYSFLRVLLERRGKAVPLTSDSHNFESVFLSSSAENEVKQKVNSLEGYERTEGGLQKELSQCFKQKESTNNLLSSEVHPRSLDVKYVGNVVVPDNSVKVSEAHILSGGHDISKMEASGGPLQTAASNLDETSVQLYFQEERNQKETSAFEELQEKADSDDITMDNDTECCSLDENDVVCSESVADLQRETCDQHDLTGEYGELEVLENLLDDLCDSSLPWQHTSQLLSEEESNFEKPVVHSNLSICESFSSVLPPFDPHEPIRESDYHASNLRMLRVSLDTVPKTPQHLAGDSSEGSIPEITQSKLKLGITTTTEDSDVESHLSLYPEDLPQLAISSLQGNTIGLHTDAPNQMALTHSHLTEESLKVSDNSEPADQKYGMPIEPPSSYPYREKPSILYQQGLPDSYLTEEALNVSGIPGSDDQNTGIPTVPSISHSPREKTGIFYHQAMPGGQVPAEALKVPAAPGPADQKTGLLPATSPSYLPRDKAGIFYQQALTGGQVPSEALKILAAPGPAGQMTGIPPVTSVPYSQREQPGVLYQQVLSGGQIPAEGLKDSVALGPAVQKTGITPATSIPYSQRDEPGIYYRQALLGGQITAEALKISSAPGPAGQKTGISPVTSPSYSPRDQPDVFYQQTLSGGQIPAEALKVSAASGPAGQKTAITPAPSLPYSQRDQPGVFYLQALLGDQIPAETLKLLAASGPAGQKTGIPPATSVPYSQRDQPGILNGQALPGDQIPAEALKLSSAPRPAGQKTSIPPETSPSYSPRDRTDVFYQQTVSGGQIPSEALKLSAASGPAGQKTSIPPATSVPYSKRDQPGFFYQQALPGGQIASEALKISSAPGPAGQKTGIPPATSPSYSPRDKPDVFYQPAVPGGQIPAEALKVSAAPGPAGQKTGITSAPSLSYSQEDQPDVFYKQALPSDPITAEALKLSAASGPAGQKTGIAPATSLPYSQRDQPDVLYRQTLLGDQIPAEALKLSAASGLAGQKTSIPPAPSLPYSQRDQPGVFYQQALPGGQITAEALKVSAASGPAGQKTGITSAPSIPYSQRDQPGVLYRQALPGEQIPSEALKLSAASGTAGQKTNIPPASSFPYSQRDQPSVFYQQGLPGGQIPAETLKLSAASGPAGQKTGIPPAPSVPYSQIDQPGVLYRQGLPGDQIPAEALKLSSASGPADQKTVITPATSVPYSQRDQPGVLYQQTLLGDQIPAEALKLSAAPGPADQKTGITSAPSVPYSQRDQPGVLYRHALPGDQIPAEALKLSAASGPADQKTCITSVPSFPYSQRDQPGVLYRQALPGDQIPAESLKLSAAPGPADQKTGIIPGPSVPYSQRDHPGVLYRQALLGDQIPAEALKLSAASGPADQKTGITSVPSFPYSQRDQPGVLYRQALPGDQIPAESLKLSAAPGPADQKTGIIPGPSVPYSQRDHPGVLYRQALLGDQIPAEALKLSAAPGPADQKTGVPPAPCLPYSQRDQPGVLYRQALLGDEIPAEALKLSAASGLADQKTGITSVPSVPYSQRDQPGVLYQQALPGDQIPAEDLKVSTAPGPAGQKTGIPPSTSFPFSQRDQPGVLYRQALPGDQIPAEDLKVSTASGPTDQKKTGITSAPSVPYSKRDQPGVFYRQGLPGDQIPAEALKHSSAPGPAGQKTGILPATSPSYSPRDKPDVFYQQTVSGGQKPAEALTVSAASGPADQKAGIPPATSVPYSQRDQPGVFYKQVLPGGQILVEALKVSATSGPADQKTGITATSVPYSQRDQPGVFYRQALPGGQIVADALKVSAAPGPAGQKTGIPPVTSVPYSQRDQPGVFYQQALTGGQIPIETQKVSAVPGAAGPKTGITPTTSPSYSPRDQPDVFYQQSLPRGQIPIESLKASAVLGPAGQKTGIPPVSSVPYSPKDKPNVVYQQSLPGGQEALRVSSVPGADNQKTRIPTLTSTSYSPRNKPGVFYQQVLPGSHIPAETLNVSLAPGADDRKISIPTITSPSYSYRGDPAIILYQQELPESHLAEEFLSSALGPADKKTGITTVSSASYPHGDKSYAFYRQALPESHVTDQALKVSTFPRSADQKVETAAVRSTSYSHRVKPGTFYRQELPDGHVTEETVKVSAIPGLADQKTLTTKVYSSSYSQREKPGVIYQQALSDSYPTKEPLKISAIPGSADQMTGIPILTSTSYSQRETSNIFYRQMLSNNHLNEEAQKVSFVPGLDDHKTGIPIGSSTFYLHREKPIIFYQQTLPDSHLPEEALKVSATPGTDQKTGIPTVIPPSYSQRDKLGIFYQQSLPSSHIPEESLTAPGPADQNMVTPTLSSSSYSLEEKPVIFYQRALTDSYLPKEALKVLSSPEPTDLQAGNLTVSSTSPYSFGEEPIVLYHQVLPDSQRSEESLKLSVISEPVDTTIPIEISPSYSPIDQTVISYQQELARRAEDDLNILGVPGLSDQNTRIHIVPFTRYLHGEKPIISYQQELTDIPEDTLEVLGDPEPADYKTGIHTITSTPYSQGEQSIISLQQELPDLTQVTLKTVKVPGLVDQKTGIQTVSSSSYSSSFHKQELPNISKEALDVLVLPEPDDPKTGISTMPLSYYSHREKPSVFSPQELPESHLTEEASKVSSVSVPVEQRAGTPSSSYIHREKPSDFSQQSFPDSDLTEESLKASTVSGLGDQKNRIPAVPSGSYSHQEKLRVSTVNLPDNQKTELPTVTHSFHLKREKPRISTVIGPDDQETPLLTVFHSSYSERVKPHVFFQQQLPDRDQSEDILKISTVPEPIDVNTGAPITLCGSYLQKEKSNNLYLRELPDRYQTEDALKVSTVPEPADQKTELPTAPPSSFSYRGKLNIFYQKDLPCRHLTEDDLKVSSGLGQSDQITGLSIISPGTYSPDEKDKLVSEHVQRLIDNLDSSDSSAFSKHMPLNSQADDGLVIIKPESIGFEDNGSEEIQDTYNSSKTLKEIRTLLMEAENIALKRCNFPAPLVPFRDVSDISFIRSKKVVCFKEPPTTDVSDGDFLHRQPYIEEESPSNRSIQKDIGTQTNLKCQRGIENWEFIRSTTIRSPLQEAESKARMALGETLRQYEAAKSAMRSEPERYSRTIGNKIIIPMMTIIKSDSSSDVSDGHGSCSWESNLPESLESVSDVLLNFFPYTSPNPSITDSREEQGMSESDDGGSVDSLAARVKNLLHCESSLNHAKQILRNAEEEECRVRARAWNLKFNLARECGYSISELNEDDRRKVEEIKAELFGHGRTTHVSEGSQSPRGIGCTPEAVCSHIIIESHEKGCFRTLTAEQPQLEDHPCIFTSAESSEMIRGQQSPSSWRTRHINFSKSLDQNNPHLKVWNSLQLQSHSPLISDDFKISKGLRMPFRENMDPWLSELVEVEPACVPPKEVEFPSSSQIPSPEPMKQFTTSITFSSHRHSQCISDSSVFKVGVTEGSQYTGASMGVFNSHITEEQNSPRDFKQKTSSPSSYKMLSHSPHKAVTFLAEKGRQNEKLFVDFEPSHREETLLERSDFNVSHSEPSTSANYTFKEVQFSDNHTHISMGRPSSTLGIKEKNVTRTADLPSHIFLEQRELFEKSKAPHADHHMKKHHSCLCPDIPSCIFLEQQELFKQSNAPHVDHEMRESHSLFSQGQDYIASDLPSPICLEQHQSRPLGIDDHMRKHHFPFSQGQDCVVEKNQHTPKSHITSMINVEVNSVSQSAPDHYTLETSASTPPSNRKALSCVRITLCPKTPSKLDSGTLDKRFHSLDSASKTRMNSEFNSDLQTISSRSLEPTSKLLTSKPIAQNQESLGFLGPKSPLDFQVVQSPLPDSNTITQDLKAIPSQNSQIVTSRQIQVNISDLEGYSKPEGTPVSADRSPEQSKTSLFASEKLSSDAVTQITTESPEKTMFSSEIFINAEDHGSKILEPHTKNPLKGPVKFASSSSVQQITTSRGTDAQPLLLPYKPPGSSKMYYVPQLETVPSFPDSKSDTTIESSHSGSNDAIAPEFPAQVLGTRDDDLSATVNIKHKEGIYSKRAVPKAPLSLGKKPFQKDNAEVQVQVAITTDQNLSNEKQKEENLSQMVLTKTDWPEEESLQKDTGGSSDATAAKHLIQVQDTKAENLPDMKPTEPICGFNQQKEEIYIDRTVSKEAWTEKKESLQIDISESECHSEFENTTHSVFRSAKFYFHHPVHLLSDQDFCHESLGRSVFMRHSWKDFFHHHSDKNREHTCLPPPYQNVDKTKIDYTRIKSLSINMNVGDKEVIPTTKSQAKDHLKSNGQTNDPKRDHKVTPEVTTSHTASLNELWNKYQERQRQQKQSDVSDRKELSLVERLDRLAKLLQSPITHSLRTSESVQDDNRRERFKEWSYKQKQQKSKFQKQKRYKSVEKGHRNICDLKKSKVLSPHQTGRSNQIKIEQIKFDKYILRKQPDLHYISNTSSDSRPSEESELFTDTPTNILSTTTSPVESDILTQTDREVTLHERSSSISTIDTARLIQAFGHERVCLSPRRVKLYSSITNQQRRYLEKRCKHKKSLNTGYPQMTSEHTRRRHIQVANHMISSDSVSCASSFLSLNSTLCNEENVHMLNKGIQAGNLEIVHGDGKHTRDVGVTFPTPSSSEARLEEDSDVTSWLEEKVEEKIPVTNYLGDKKLKKNKKNSCEVFPVGVSWFVPVENVKSGSKKENLLKSCGPGISWFEPITKTKPWREPLREQNWQGQRMEGWGSLADPGRDYGRGLLKPFVKATLQEALHFHRPDFISRSGERIKRLKLIVQERKLQNMFESERDVLFNTIQPQPRRVFMAAQNKPIGKKEMIQRSKRIYQQLPEVQKKKEEEKRKLEYKSYRLRAQLYKTKVTNRLLGRKVPWD